MLCTPVWLLLGPQRLYPCPREGPHAWQHPWMRGQLPLPLPVSLAATPLLIELTVNRVSSVNSPAVCQVPAIQGGPDGAPWHHRSMTGPSLGFYVPCRPGIVAQRVSWRLLRLGAPLLFQVSCPSWAGGCCLPSLASTPGGAREATELAGLCGRAACPPGLAAHQLALGPSWLLPGPVQK